MIDKEVLEIAHRHLRKCDEVMADLIKRSDPVTLANNSFPHYHSLVRAIINQQLSVKAGRTIEKRALSKNGGRYFKAEKILKINATTLRECGLSYNKIRYIHTLAQAIVDGKLNFRKLVKQDDETISNTLMGYPGIGKWSADMFLMTSLRRQDIFPVGDLVIRKSMQIHYKLSEDTTYDDYKAIANAWQPYRTIASYYLWKNAS